MVKLFTDVDLDGLGCGILRNWHLVKGLMFYCSYRNLNQRVEAFIDDPKHGK